jgi:hypothetical protein
VAAPVIATSNAPGLTIPTPTTMAQLQAMLPAEGRVRLTLTPELVRQVLAHNERANPIIFGGPETRYSYLSPIEARQMRVRAAANVVRLAELIVSGQWDPEFGSSSSNGAILLTPNLEIGNGRHRLRAVDLADWPITVYVELCQWGPHMGPPLVWTRRAADEHAQRLHHQRITSLWPGRQSLAMAS